MSKTAIFDIESQINSISMTKSSLFDIEIFSTQHKLPQPYIVRLGELFDFLVYIVFQITIKVFVNAKH